MICCPCCRSPVGVQPLDTVISKADLSAIDAAILRAIWEGRGLPVITERIFDAMYADDPNGGPTPSNMYKSFKTGLDRVNKRLKGSGISIENKYRNQYCLRFGSLANV